MESLQSKLIIGGTPKGEICIFQLDEEGIPEVLREPHFSEEIVGMQTS